MRVRLLSMEFAECHFVLLELDESRFINSIQTADSTNMITILFTMLQIAMAQVYFENMDEEIRYHEDPFYATYIREKVSQIEAEKKAQLDQRKASAKHKEVSEKNRLAFIEQRNRSREKQIITDKSAYSLYEKQRAEQKASIEKSRESFVAKRDEQTMVNQRTRAIQLAKMKQEVSRLPANYFDTSERPRVDKKKRKFP